MSCELNRQTIILTHGIGASPLMMSIMCRRIRRLGYRVINWGYSSLFSSIEKHGQRLGELIQELEHDDSVEKIHVVAHSMGTIVSRKALSVVRSKKLCRAVLLAPPNQGTPAANFYAKFLGWMCPPAIELQDSPGSFVNQLPKDLTIPFAVIAAKIDWIVPEWSTHLPNQTEHRCINGIHSGLVFRKDVVELVHHFLQTGTFPDSQVGQIEPDAAMPDAAKSAESDVA